MKKQNRKEKLNEEINFQKIRLTGGDFKGEVVSLKEALEKAKKIDLDLVLISENNDIGVCRIMNYEKFMYEQGKKPKNKPLEMKEIKLGANTSENDLQYRIKHMIEFLQKGHKVKISLQFKGRQMQHIDIGQAQILKMIMAVSEYGTPEAMPKLEGKKMFATVKPKSSK